MTDSPCNSFLLYRNPATNRWSVDGCHAEGEDLTKTFQIIARHFPSDIYLLATIDGGMLRVTDVTDRAQLAVLQPSRLNSEFSKILDDYQKRKRE